MKKFIAYEMEYTGDNIAGCDIHPIHFSDRYYPRYERIYNECFYEMREALDIMPYNFYSDIRQLDGKKDGIFLLVENGTIIGSVACYGTEIDDLIVNRNYQGKGYGKTLLIWAVNHIRESTGSPITLHVAGWNRRALNLYTQNGFVIKTAEEIG